MGKKKVSFKLWTGNRQKWMVKTSMDKPKSVYPNSTLRFRIS